jgi:hypothetical protein
MSDTPRKPRRWLSSAIAASADAKAPAAPFARAGRPRRTVAAAPKRTAAAAR